MDVMFMHTLSGQVPLLPLLKRGAISRYEQTQKSEQAQQAARLPPDS